MRSASSGVAAAAASCVAAAAVVAGAPPAPASAAGVAVGTAAATLVVVAAAVHWGHAYETAGWVAAGVAAGQPSTPSPAGTKDCPAAAGITAAAAAAGCAAALHCCHISRLFCCPAPLLLSTSPSRRPLDGRWWPAKDRLCLLYFKISPSLLSAIILTGTACHGTHTHTHISSKEVKKHMVSSSRR